MQLPSKSFAMVQTAKRELSPMDIDIPDIDEDSAILKLEACGICGSDYEQFEDVLRTPMPVIPGHEPLGTIAKIGDNAARGNVNAGLHDLRRHDDAVGLGRAGASAEESFTPVLSFSRPEPAVDQEQFDLPIVHKCR